MTPDALDPPDAPIRSGSVLQTVGRNLGWMLASRGVLAVLSLFYLAIVTRALGINGFGRFALITGAAQALATLVAFQSWQVVVQYGVAPAQAGDDAKLARLFRGSLMLDLASAVVGALLAVLILELWSDEFGIGPTLKRAALIFAIVDVITIRSTPVGILRLRDRFSHAALADSVTPVARFIGAILVWLVHPTVQGFLFAWGVAEMLTATAYWILAGRGGDLKLIRRGRGLRQLLAEHPGILRFAVSTNANSTLGMASKQVPLLFVGAVLGPAAAGSFRLAAQVAQALTKLSQLLSRAAFPEVVRAVRDASPASLRYILLRMMGASLVTGVVILGIVAIFGRPALDLIGGRHFAHSYGVLMYMAAAGCVELATITLETIMTARGRAGTVFLVRAAGAVVIFAIAWPLLHRFGATGMAVAVLAGSLAVTAIMGLTAWRAIQPERASDGSGGEVEGARP